MRTKIEVDLAKRAASRLGRLPAFWETPHHHCLDLTAVVLGFDGWRGFQASAESHAPVPLDEALDAAQLEARREAQAIRLGAAMPELTRQSARSLIAQWQPTAAHPTTKLNSSDDIKSVVRAKNAFLSQGLHRAYVAFFRDMLGWPLVDINLAAKDRQPLFRIHSACFDLCIPVLAPGPLADNPTGFEPKDLRALEKAYPDGTIALLGLPLTDETKDGYWFTPGALVMDGVSTELTLRAGLEHFDQLLEIRTNPDGYRVRKFIDAGQWCAKTFAMCRNPKWQLDHDFDGEEGF